MYLRMPQEGAETDQDETAEEANKEKIEEKTEAPKDK
jgi:hypothetical protein